MTVHWDGNPRSKLAFTWQTPGMHYDRWLLNVRVNGQDRGLDREYLYGWLGIGRDVGVVFPDRDGPGLYRLAVEGCDTTTGGGHSCKQGFTNPVFIYVP
ncbi:hypothetical protein ACFQ1S_36105 [Kibdelosporangium lantanae]|uniref:Uncharacterized protein n=1 Tax=Kibdelosporangium lantanae TaxID=1497396 RepID=A0ABW3MM77_9PSEU